MATKAFQILLDELVTAQGNVAGHERNVEQKREALKQAEGALEIARRDMEEIEGALRLIDPVSSKNLVEAVKQEARDEASA